jgi:hypothetical protein
MPGGDFEHRVMIDDVNGESPLARATMSRSPIKSRSCSHMLVLGSVFLADPQQVTGR